MKNVFIILISILTLSCSSDDDNHLVIENNCDYIAEIIQEEDFDAINTSNYGISEVELTNDCLNITFSSSGCGTELWEENLYSVDAFYTVFPIERSLKLELINNEACLAVFEKSVSFNLTAFQIDGQTEVPLNIEGWDEQIMYEY